MKALKYLGKAAEQGHIAAHYHLAIIYRNGVEDVQADKDAFLRHLSVAVEGGDPDALFCLADCFMQGLDGYPKDPAMAVPYLERAVAHEHADAAVTLGALYYGGLAGLGQDKRKAFELYLQLQSLALLTRGAISQVCIILAMVYRKTKMLPDKL